MTYEQWIEHCKKVILQYEEGAIFAVEAFNSIVGRAAEVEQDDVCEHGYSKQVRCVACDPDGR